jgi:hypothetical protein
MIPMDAVAKAVSKAVAMVIPVFVCNAEYNWVRELGALGWDVQSMW